MKSFFLFSLYLLGFLSFLSCSHTYKRLSNEVYRPTAINNDPSATEISYKGEYMKRLGEFDNQGTLFNELEGRSFFRFDNNLNWSYGYARKLEFFGTLRYRNQQAQDSKGNMINSSGGESVALGLKYAFDKIQSNYYAIDLELRQTMYKNHFASANDALPDPYALVLGDSGLGIKLRTSLAAQLSQTFWFAFELAYHIPNSYLSHELVGKAELAYAPVTSFALYFGSHFIQSLGMDKSEEKPESKGLVSLGGGADSGVNATALYNSVNRSLISPYAGLKFNIGKVTALDLQGFYVAKGVSTDKAMGGLLQLSFNVGGVSENQARVSKFKDYNVEAYVSRTSKKDERFIEIDKGMSKGVEEGMSFDIYKSDYFGGNILVARGVAVKVGAKSAIILMNKYYVDIPIKEGFTARSY